MLTKEQLEARKIGGSDVATILGLNPWKTAAELWLEKRGETEPDDLSENENVEAGNVMEDAIAELTQRRLTRMWEREIKLRRSNQTIVNPKYPWLTVHIDRDIVGDKRGVELKNVGWRSAPMWGEPGTDAIPEYYITQPHTYMLVKDYPVWTVSAYFGGSDLRVYEVQRDREMDEIIIERTHDFWHRCVIGGVPPEVDLNSKGAATALKKLYPGTTGETIQATQKEHNWLEVMEDAAKLASQYESVAEVAKLHLLSCMKGATNLAFDDGRILRRKQVNRAGYTVEPSSYVESRIVKPKKGEA
jgi:putative phage-type endonuclease